MEGPVEQLKELIMTDVIAEAATITSVAAMITTMTETIIEGVILIMVVVGIDELAVEEEIDSLMAKGKLVRSVDKKPEIV